MLPDQCRYITEGAMILSMGIRCIQDRQKKMNDMEEKTCHCSITMNPTQSDTRFNCTYTVSRQHLTTQHEDSTLFI